MISATRSSWLGCERDSNKSSVCLQTGDRISACVTTSEVKCYNFIVGLRSLPQIEDMISQVYGSTEQRSLARGVYTCRRDTETQLNTIYYNYGEIDEVSILLLKGILQSVTDSQHLS